VIADGPVDYIRLMVSADGPGIENPAFTDTQYWTTRHPGVVLTRKQPDGGFEAAAALLEGEPVMKSGALLGVLKLGEVKGTVTLRCSCRLSPDDGIIEGGTVLSAGEVFARPVEFMLMQNMPNPFNPSTVIRFALPEAAHVRLTVYTVTGQKAVNLRDGFMSAGYHEIRWDAAGFPSGTYFCTCRAGSKEKTIRMMIIK